MNHGKKAAEESFDRNHQVGGVNESENCLERRWQSDHEYPGPNGKNVGRVGKTSPSKSDNGSFSESIFGLSAFRR